MASFTRPSLADLALRPDERPRAAQASASGSCAARAAPASRRRRGPGSAPAGRRGRGLVPMGAVAVSRRQRSISEQMKDLKDSKKGAFIPFIMAGDPDLKTTAEAIRILDEEGADIIELGVPYSDPLADGPVIQSAATRALARGTTLDQVLEMVGKVAPHLRASLVLFTYYNPIMRRGAKEFARQAAAAGASGLLVPDIPLEETGAVREAAGVAGLELVLLTTPTTPAPRMRAIAAASQGFVYLVSVTGVTGQRGAMEARVEGLIADLHAATDKAVAVGFGVSGAVQAAQLRAWGADGVIVGSALVKALGEASDIKAGLDALQDLARAIRAAT